MSVERLIARKLAELFGFNRGVRTFYASCRFDELSRGFVSCLFTLASKSDFTTPQLDFYTEIDDHGIRQGDTGQIIT